MNLFLTGATVLLLGFVPLFLVAMRGSPLSGLVALQLAATNTVLLILLLAEGVGRSAYFGLAPVLAVGSFAGALVYSRLLERVAR